MPQIFGRLICCILSDMPAKIEKLHGVILTSIVLFHSFVPLYIFYREMTKILNPRYKAPNRDSLANQLIPAWYEVEKKNLMSELKLVKKAAITADGWTSFSQDHYLTVTLHWVRDGQNKEKVLKTKAVYQAQTEPAVAEEINGILEEFEVRQKVVAVDNAANMRVAVFRAHTKPRSSEAVQL